MRCYRAYRAPVLRARGLRVDLDWDEGGGNSSRDPTLEMELALGSHRLSRYVVATPQSTNKVHSMILI